MSYPPPSPQQPEPWQPQSPPQPVWPPAQTSGQSGEQPYGQPLPSGQPQPFGQPQPHGQSGPYGQPPYYGQPQPHGQSGPYGQPPYYGQPQPSGQGPGPYGPVYPAPRRRPRHPVAKLGPFTWRDLITVIAYGLLMFLGLGALVLLIPGVRELFNGDEIAMIYTANLVAYAISFALSLWAVGPELWRSFKTFRWYPWAKYFGVPGAWFVTIIVSAIVVSIAASASGMSPEDLQQSQNQQAAAELMDAIPMPLMALMVVVMGPLVEEYVFRHLLVGKLSRWINPWILVGASALLFMSLHFIGKEWPTVVTAAPYVIMGISFGVGYLLSGKSLGYAWVMHAFSNFMALVMSKLFSGLDGIGSDPVSGEQAFNAVAAPVAQALAALSHVLVG